jgi:tellurite resistance protein TehA-like permease
VGPCYVVLHDHLGCCKFTIVLALRNVTDANQVIHQWALYFHLGWWAMVFPNTGFIIATISIGNSLGDETILFVANGLTIAILCMWAFVLFNHVQAVVVCDIMYPMMDEDNADH